jgi:hypothetical protein
LGVFRSLQAPPPRTASTIEILVAENVALSGNIWVEDNRSPQVFPFTKSRAPFEMHVASYPFSSLCWEFDLGDARTHATASQWERALLRVDGTTLRLRWYM